MAAYLAGSGHVGLRHQRRGIIGVIERCLIISTILAWRMLRSWLLGGCGWFVVSSVPAREVVSGGLLAVSA